MQALDSTGRQVSLLNDDGAGYDKFQRPFAQRPLSFQMPASRVLSRPYLSPRSCSSSPNTPELLRSDSYDSQTSNDPISPLTPSTDMTYPRSSLYPPLDVATTKRPGLGAAARGSAASTTSSTSSTSSRSASFDDESTAAQSPCVPDARPGKRYPCRYRESHRCDKTFTTSGHASRHSKIHTAEKAVQCTFAGCQKKFTRADNMKQHLETHYKDKSRSCNSGRASHKSALAEARRNSSASCRTTRPSNPRPSKPAPQQQWDGDSTAQYPLPLSRASATWNMRSVNLPLLSRPVAVRNPSSGLDALAMAVACQESSS
ncbi:hypothetical protein CDD82_7247 [Ophiocordyceps australis]|uniref:C2H2 type master regulator of conidiophore development brlA n=1 Tax=Ophiocordyceps australis TaxID=1399860 RepID=A0A2C5YRJ0_9HYPO|nr:hypothetical protein CDD82_7247 [Ophiocordyceps australis]